MGNSVKIHSAEFYSFFVYDARTNHKLMPFSAKSQCEPLSENVGDEIYDVVSKESPWYDENRPSYDFLNVVQINTCLNFPRANTLDKSTILETFWEELS